MLTYCLMDPISQSPPSVGCKWSSTDWSCAYDCIFIVLFYAYQAGDDVLKESCHAAGTALMDLTKVYNTLLGGMIQICSHKTCLTGLKTNFRIISMSINLLHFHTLVQ